MDLKTYLATGEINQVELARRIGVTRSLVSQWVNNILPISAEKVLPIEAATGGAVRRYELRPDIYPPSEYGAA